MDYSFQRPPKWEPGEAAQPTIVYLDQWCWDRIARDRAGLLKGQVDEGIYDFLRRKAHEQKILLPLSQAHYRENWVRDNEDARWDTAVVMAELSGFNTMTSVGLQDWEAEVALADYFQLDIDPGKPKVLGWGYQYCFRGIEMTARILDTRTGQRADWSGLPLRQQQTLNSLETESAYRLELAMLALREPRLERVGLLSLPSIPEVSEGPRFLEAQLSVNEAIASYGRSRKVVRNSIVVPAFIAAEPFLARASERLGVPWVPALDRLSQRAPEERVGAMHDVLMAMPVQGVFTELRLRAHMKESFRWEASDLMDFLAMAQSASFADYIVADKRTYNLLNETHIGPKYAVEVMRRLSDLRVALDNVRT